MMLSSEPGFLENMLEEMVPELASDKKNLNLFVQYASNYILVHGL